MMNHLLVSTFRHGKMFACIAQESVSVFSFPVPIIYDEYADWVKKGKPSKS